MQLHLFYLTILVSKISDCDITSCAAVYTFILFNLFISPFNPSMSLNPSVQPNPSNPIITQTKHFNLVAFLDSCLLLMTCRSCLTNDVYCCIFFLRKISWRIAPVCSRAQGHNIIWALYKNSSGCFPLLDQLLLLVRIYSWP